MTLNQLIDILATTETDEADVLLTLRGQKCQFIHDGIPGAYINEKVYSVGMHKGKLIGAFRFQDNIIDVEYNKNQKCWIQIGEAFNLSEVYGGN